MSIKHVIFDGFGTLVERRQPMSFHAHMKCTSAVPIDWNRAMTACFAWEEWAHSIGQQAKLEDDLRSVVLYRDIAQTLHMLTAANIGFSVMSNLASCYGAPLQKALAPFAVEHWFLSYADGMEKPALSYYMHALEKLNLPGENVLFVGDHPKHDVLWPAIAGLNALLVRRDLLSMHDMLEPWCS